MSYSCKPETSLNVHLCPVESPLTRIFATMPSSSTSIDTTALSVSMSHKMSPASIASPAMGSHDMGDHVTQVVRWMGDNMIWVITCQSH